MLLNTPTGLPTALMDAVEALAAFSFFVLIWCWFISKNKSPIKDWPFVGMLPGVLLNASRIHYYFSHLLRQSNHTIKIKGPWFSNLNFILTSDPENIHYILSTSFANFNKGPNFKEVFEVLGDGILVADSDSWKMQRKLTHTLFRQSNFLSLLETTAQQKVQNGLFKILDHASESGLQVDMQDLCQRFTFDVTWVFLLGSDLNSLSVELPAVPFAKAPDDTHEVLLQRHLKPRSLWRLQKWFQVGVEKKAITAAETFDNFIYHHISLKRELNNRKSDRDEADENDGSSDLISFLMQEEVMKKCNNNSAKPHDEFLRDSVMNLLSAGRDTSSTTLTWFFWLVATNPLIKINTRDWTLFPNESRNPWRFPSFAELNKLAYLHATLCETLRLYPPVPINRKASIKPDTLPSGHQVNQETEILLSIYTMGRMQEIWGADASAFNPDRWISDKGKIIDVPSYKFNTFSAGPRTCVGKDLAFMELKIAAAAIIWSYDLHVATGAQSASSLALHMEHGLKVNVTTKTIL
uniref:Cytochrome P450 n=1 Tax=Kalanchoe fedtschenkoi TaxID=63787 RepID=A0A7N0RFM0_KALFE